MTRVPAELEGVAGRFSVLLGARASALFVGVVRATPAGVLNAKRASARIFEPDDTHERAAVGRVRIDPGRGRWREVHENPRGAKMFWTNVNPLEKAREKVAVRRGDAHRDTAIR